MVVFEDGNQGFLYGNVVGNVVCGNQKNHKKRVIDKNDKRKQKTV